MIATLQGTIELLGSEWAIIDVGGIGFHVHMPTTAITKLGAKGEEIKLHTHLQFREDHIALYGFTSPDELSLFQTLIGVSGLGPKLALAMLSAMNVEQLTMAIATDNTEILTIIPGLGKKTANRLVLELKDKISAGKIAAPAIGLAEENADVLAALTSLGYSVSEASRAITNLPPSPDIPLEEKVKLALQYFGSV